jgi:hypothetical protein
MEDDRAFAEILNDCLDAIEAEQAGVEECLARYPQHATRLEGLLWLSREVRGMPLPTPTPEMLAAGERQLLQAARARAADGHREQGSKNLLATLSDRLIEPAKARIRSWPKWAVPVLAVSGSVALLFACVLVIILGASATWSAFRDKDVASSDPSAIQTHSPSPTPTSETSVVQSPIETPATSVAARPVQTPEPSAAQDLARTPDQEAAHIVFLPMVSDPLSPTSAMVQGIKGLVETGTDGESWAPAGERQIVKAGQRVRTGALSSAEITFYDGSTAYLGPDTEVSVDYLGQDPDDGSRIIEITQWMGETDHDVVPAYGDNARYEVKTPSGTGEAMGTLFHVLVTPALFTRFSVGRGVVAVTNVDVTVIVVAGQLTTIPVDQPPSEPVFRVTGEGEVTQTGAEWEIGGQVFATNERTIIAGNPRVGDWVSVRGHLLPDETKVADQIVLVRRSPENRFTITGEAETIEGTFWIVAGQTIYLAAETDIQGGIQEKDTVRVEGVIQEDGALVAESIRLIEGRGAPFGFVGVVGEISGTYWVISGVSVAVDAGTVAEDGLAVGDTVQVRGVILDGETWLARSIKRFTHREQAFEFVGAVESIAPWVVSGIAFETRDWTEIEDGIKVSDLVRVEGWILADGTWVADEIELLYERPLRFEFVGVVRSVDPWVVGGVPLAVDGDTKVKGRVVVGMLAKVKGRILPDGTWLATEIKPASTVGLGRGCFTLGVLVVDVNPSQVLLGNGLTVDLGGSTIVDGEIVANSLVLLQICVADDGTVHVTRMIVVLVPPPPPPPLPAGPCGPCRGGVTYFTLRYVGIAPNAHVQVVGKKNGLSFSGIVQPGGIFSFSGTGKDGKLDKEIAIVVNGRVTSYIHTSCSKPVDPGVVYGEFQIVTGYSKDGGLFCPVPVPSSNNGDDKGGSQKGGSKKGGSKKGGSK